MGLRMLIVDAGISPDILPDKHLYNDYSHRFKYVIMPMITPAWSPLHLAAAIGHLKCIEILINAGANVDISSSDNRKTPMHIAALNGRATVVQMLIDAGANVNAKDDKGATPMKSAAQNGHKECVKLIISHV